MMTSDDTPYDLPDGVPHQMMAGLLSFEASLALCDELLGGAVLGRRAGQRRAGPRRAGRRQQLESRASVALRSP